MQFDAVVIGAGPNGLVSANRLVDAGWSVLVVEAQPEPGGAVRSAELSRPACVHDLFSVFYPLAAGSPHIRALELARYGLRWRRAPIVVSHPLPDGSCASLRPSVDDTAASLEQFAVTDGDAWAELQELWTRVEEPLLHALFDPFPPARATSRLAATLGPGQLLGPARRRLVSSAVAAVTGWKEGT